MKRSFVVLIHIGFWFCYLFLVIIVLGMKFGGEPNVLEARIEPQKCGNSQGFYLCKNGKSFGENHAQ